MVSVEISPADCKKNARNVACRGTFERLFSRSMRIRQYPMSPRSGFNPVPDLKLFRGAKQTLKRKSVLAFVVEFTEENMRKSGYSARQLAAQLIEYGYQPYKLATEAADLIPFKVQESIEYENILFTHDLAAVLDRIRQTPIQNARRSKEIVDRGSAAEALVRSLWSIEKEATKRLALINELTAECRSRDQTIAELRRKVGSN